VRWLHRAVALQDGHWLRCRWIDASGNTSASASYTPRQPHLDGATVAL